MKRYYCYLALIFTFILGNYNGRIALWHENSNHPVQVFPYYVHVLPPADQERLKNGIPIGSPEQLQMLLQDYLS